MTPPKSDETNAEKIKDMVKWVGQLDDELNKIWAFVHNLEKKVDGDLSDIKVTLATMNGKLDQFIAVCDVKNYYEGEMEKGRKDIIEAVNQKQKEEKKAWVENYRFWLTIALMLLAFIVGFFGMNGMKVPGT